MLSYKETYCHYKQGKAEIAESAQFYFIEQTLKTCLSGRGGVGNKCVRAGKSLNYAGVFINPKTTNNGCMFLGRLFLLRCPVKMKSQRHKNREHFSKS